MQTNNTRVLVVYDSALCREMICDFISEAPGCDGADGCRMIREKGGYVLGQDEATSAVYGMNKVAFVAGNVDQQFAIDDAAKAVGMRVKQLCS